MIEVVGFPVPAPPLPVQNVNFGPDPQATDDDPECSGTVAVPTAPPGKVCLYRSTSSNATLSGGTSQNASFLTFAIVGVQAAAGEYSAIGTWAYTVP